MNGSWNTKTTIMRQESVRREQEDENSKRRARGSATVRGVRHMSRQTGQTRKEVLTGRLQYILNRTTCILPLTCG
ncbi:hypothetical protein X801_07986 [Opisthorchis viverrini]|uniref:Uncharacterized protein n=1 Tax=Opisthorchis viverrini TaxID=6198 RepID=A0A1S8WP75_OPIVI|nr:hypothetical protein X801_07986 [Opisthorchis viverrini]